MSVTEQSTFAQPPPPTVVKLPLRVAVLQMEVNKLAAALQITESDVLELFDNSRFSSWFIEKLAASLLGFSKHTPRGNAFAGTLPIGRLGRYSIAVRTFSGRRGIRFQLARFKGAGRKCTSENLISSLEEFETILIADLRDFPTIALFPIDSKWLLRLVREGKLGPAGMSSKKFDAWIDEAFDIQRIDAGVKIQ